jgi:hypothetical protein
MDRRYSLKALLALSAGVALLPSCGLGNQGPSVTLGKESLSSSDDQLLEALADTLIPGGSSPGAKEVGAHRFALLMLNDCYAPEDQARFVTGLKAFEAFSQKTLGQAFQKATVDQRGSVLRLMEASKDDSDVAYFYHTMKGLTIEAFTQSQYYLTKVHPYVLVPGRFYGCVPVKKSAKQS